MYVHVCTRKILTPSPILKRGRVPSQPNAPLVDAPDRINPCTYWNCMGAWHEQSCLHAARTVYLCISSSSDTTCV